MLIPPSLLLILFGIIAEVSIGQLFTGGIIPGIVMSAAFMLLITGLVRFAPSFVFAGGRPPEVTMRLPLLKQARMIAPVLILMLLVIGGIYGGYFTPTEAGGMGAIGALLLALARRTLTWRNLWKTLLETGHVTASLAFLLVAAHLYGNMIALSGLPNQLGQWMAASSLGFYQLLMIYLVIILWLGTILDSASIMLIMIPLVLPIVVAKHANVIWFGVTTVVAVEVGLLTPPLGIACFAVRSNLQNSRIGLNDVFIGAMPFAVVMVAVLILMIIFPEIVTVLL
jgi:tripartite ATP-independent transporter DctM subunit